MLTNELLATVQNVGAKIHEGESSTGENGSSPDDVIDSEFTGA
jgi:hypothetical protein